MAHSDDTATRLLASMGSDLARHDRAAMVTDALRAVELGEIDIPTLYAQVLTPLLDDVGESWHEGELRIWQEHLATGAVMTVIESLYPKVRMLAAHSPECGSVIVLATPSEEQHVVGLRMVADLFELAGWKVVYLGADVPKDEIEDAVRAIPADAVVMSASTGYQRVLLRHIADNLHNELPDVRIWVGGHAFAEEHEGWPDEEILDLPAIRHAAAKACHEAAARGARKEA